MKEKFPIKDTEKIMKYVYSLKPKQAKNAAKYFKEEDFTIYKWIVNKFNLVEEKISIFEKYKDYFKAGQIAEENGMIKRALENYSKSEEKSKQEELIEMIKFPIKGLNSISKINLLSKLMKKTTKNPNLNYKKFNKNYKEHLDEIVETRFFVSN